jgi:hypothetical protein
MSVQVTGDFLIINDKITVKITEIISIKPRSLVSVEQFTGKILAKDYPKIILITNQEELEILYSTDDERDNALINIKKVIAEYTSKSEKTKEQSSININVSESSNVNIVSQSNYVEISHEIKKDVNSKITELSKKLENITEIDKELKTDIYDCVNDIRNKLNSNRKIPKYSLNGLLDLTSKISSISSLGVEIAKLLGV